MSLSEQEEQRRKSREEIIELGIDPYPSESFNLNTDSEEIKSKSGWSCSSLNSIIDLWTGLIADSSNNPSKSSNLLCLALKAILTVVKYLLVDFLAWALLWK